MKMSKNKKINYTKHHIQGRQNIYGLCPCSQCRRNRSKYKASIERIKHKLRTSWKTGKDFVKGLLPTQNPFVAMTLGFLCCL
jgi:hypothetical protein